MGSARRLDPPRFILALSSALLVLCAALSGGPQEILGVLPAILLALALCFERYPGEELIGHLAERLRPRRPVRAVAAPAPTRLAVAAVLRLRLLLVASRPLRGPPRLSPVQP